MMKAGFVVIPPLLNRIRIRPGQIRIIIQVSIVVPGIIGKGLFEGIRRSHIEVCGWEINAGDEAEGFCGEPGPFGDPHVLNQ